MIKSANILGTDIKYVVARKGVDKAFAAQHTKKNVKEIGILENADAAINVNFAEYITQGVPIGRVIIDGKEVVHDIEKTKPRDEIYMLPDGSFHIGKAPSNAVWALQGSPRILKDGKSYTAESVKRDQLNSGSYAGSNYRTGIGVTSSGNLVGVRTKEKVTMKQLENIMLHLDCPNAINGDGGGSSYLWPDDNGWGRDLGAALCYKEGVEDRMRIAIDAGHGPETAGKRCPDDSMREFQFNSVVARYVNDSLKDYTTSTGKVVETKYMHADDGSRDVSLDDRISKANDWPADVYVSIHANALGTGWNDANGIETYTSNFCSAKSTELAEAVQKELISLTGRDDRGVKKMDFAVIAKTDMPAILVESGFMTNHEEADLLKSDSYRKIVAKAIVMGLVDVFGLKTTSPVEQPPKDLIRGFEDLNGHWALQDILPFIDAGLMNGVSKTEFGPDQMMTRAQFCVMMRRMGFDPKEVI